MLTHSRTTGQYRLRLQTPWGEIDVTGSTVAWVFRNAKVDVERLNRKFNGQG